MHTLCFLSLLSLSVLAQSGRCMGRTEEVTSYSVPSAGSDTARPDPESSASVLGHEVSWALLWRQEQPWAAVQVIKLQDNQE